VDNVIDGLAELVKCKTKDKQTEASLHWGVKSQRDNKGTN